jgi:hypothetical protein
MAGDMSIVVRFAIDSKYKSSQPVVPSAGHDPAVHDFFPLGFDTGKNVDARIKSGQGWLRLHDPLSLYIDLNI